MSILNEIVRRTRDRIDEKKRYVSTEILIEAAEQRPVGNFPFEKALRNEDIAFICEIKKASPSMGLLTNDFAYMRIAKEYQRAGAAAISVLTEPFYFQGNDGYLKEIADKVSVPILRKDFVVDEYMIYETKFLGASAILLICAVLDDASLKRYIETAHRLGLSVLAEAHNEKEVASALDAGARVIGVNNRDLRTFGTDITISERLRPLVPKDRIFVSESGIRTPADIDALRKIGADAVLIGETLMRSPDRAKELRRLRGDAVG